jgi:hypothetical protein
METVSVHPDRAVSHQLAQSSQNFRQYEFDEDSHEIRDIVAPFGLTDLPVLLRHMYETGAILAGGAAMNLCYTQIHPTHTQPIHPDSDLDFWVADPTPCPSHARRVYYGILCDRWDTFLRIAGYESYCPSRTPNSDASGDPPYTDDDEGGGFLSDSGIRLRVRYYRRMDPAATTHNRIQLIFYDAAPADEFPATTLVRQFDLSICRCMVFTSAVNRRWFARTYAYQSLQDEVIATVGSTVSARTEARVQRYLARYPYFSWYTRAGAAAEEAAAPTG